MRTRRNRPRYLTSGPSLDGGFHSVAFVHIKLLTYMYRLLQSSLELTREAFGFLYDLLNPELAGSFFMSVTELVPAEKQSDNYEEKPMNDTWDYESACVDIFRHLDRDERCRARSLAMQFLEVRMKEFVNDAPTTLESNIAEFQKMFHLDDIETELCIFLFITTNWRESSAFFEDYLECHRYSGRKWLASALDCRESDLAASIGGKLDQIGILDSETYRSCLELKTDFVQKLQNLTPVEFRNQFIKKTRCDLIPLDSHMIEPDITSSLLKMLSFKPETSTHILLYGPPGTGKTSYAYGIATKLGLECYQMDHASKDNSGSRRAAITACVNIASETENALFVADDCDLVLNTRGSWAIFGETPDRSWLHEVLEKPGVRMIWIVNCVHNIEESVARRFALSVHFKPFTRSQRAQLWHSIIKKHKVKRYFKDADIEQLAGRFTVSAGVIDNAIRKAAESHKRSSCNLRNSVILSLESHTTLSQGGMKQSVSTLGRDTFNHEGVSLSGTDVKSLLNELKSFVEYSRERKSEEPGSMSLLFHGSPGTGKSALARHIATHLEKEVVFKRASDLFSKWVGETEQNIKAAYQEAQAREAVLIFDEADSLIFGRDRAEHSWELSFTNEFLTWMESFNGIQIFTTNRIRDLDSASLRRFSHKIEFGYLKPEGNAIFYRSYLAPLITKKPDESVNQRLGIIDNLAPGDFKSVRDRFRFRKRESISHSALVSALEEESGLKLKHSGSSRIGF